MANNMMIDAAGRRPRPLLAPGRVFVYAVLVLTSLYYLLPLYVMIITSVKDLDAIRYGNIFIPTASPTIQPWIKAWSEACTGLNCNGLAPGFFNSVIPLPTGRSSSPRRSSRSCSSVPSCPIR
jgi:glucose/mannose transport system permease protein